MTICATILLRSAFPGKTLASQATEALSMVQSRYAIPNSSLYRDAVDSQKPSDQPAFCWGVGVFLPALNAAVAVDKTKAPFLASYANAIQVYWNPKGPVPGYDVLPGPKDVDRYYDDNEWMVMALADTSDRLQNKKYLRWAEDALKYVLSGEDSVLGGGIYWKENGKTSKNACSNGPAAAACLAVYTRNHDHALLTKAKEIYTWCKSHLQDPQDHLFWDSINLDGKIGRAKWSYNTALMIRSGSELFRITHDPTYAKDVREMVSSSVLHWYDPVTGAIKDGGRFAHLLIESWIWANKDVPNSFANQDFSALIHRPLVYVQEDTRLNDFYGSQWNSGVSKNAHRFELIDQACAIRAFYVVAAQQ